MPIYTTQFKNPNDFPGLISLAEAAQNREIKYGERKPKAQRRVSVVNIKAFDMLYSTVKRPLRLIPLEVAQAREDIRTRDEGFEILEDWNALNHWEKQEQWCRAHMW